MKKLITLTLDGNFEKGFQIRFSIAPEGSSNQTEIRGKLPQNIQIIENYQEWIDAYKDLGEIWRSRVIHPIGIGIGPSYQSKYDECKRLAKDLCNTLNKWLMSSDFITIRDHWQGGTNHDDEIRVLIRTDNQQLWKLPWHKLDFIRAYKKIEIALGPNEFVSHFPPLIPYKKKPEVRILAILGDDTNINVEKDREELEQLGKSTQAEIKFLVKPQIKELSKELWEQHWDILFFSGHSNTEGDKGKIYINEKESLDINSLKESLQKAVEYGLKIAIFNSCEGLGLAQLHDLLIPQLLVMREPIPDLVAQAFLKHFLSSFSQENSSFYSAVRESRKKLEIEEVDFPCATWLPMICQHPAIIPPTWEDLKNQGVIPTLLLNGRFKLIKPLNLSEGAFGAIYLAKDNNMPHGSNNFCVVKKLKQEWADLETAQRLFANEARFLNQLNSVPHIPKFIDYFQQDNNYYLVQEYFEGEPLSEILRQNKFDEMGAIMVCKSVSKILKAVHELGLIHRDIKPSNIMKCQDDYYLIDFGAAKLNSVANPTIAIGTPHYAAPEQFNGNPCFASDIYALGMTTIQAVTGVHPSELKRDNKGNIIQLQSGDTKISKSFVDCLNKMVAEKISDRYQNAEDVIKILSSIGTVLGPDEGKIKKKSEEITKLVLMSILLLMVVISPIIYKLISDNSSIPKPTKTLPIPPDESHITKNVFPNPTVAPQNKIKIVIAGSISLVLHNNFYKKLFEQKFPTAFVDLRYDSFALKSSNNGMQALCNEEINLAAVSEFIGKKCPKGTKKEGHKLFYHKVGDDALSVIVDAKNPVDNLTTAQVQKIFQCQVTNWSNIIPNVNWTKDKNIFVYNRNKKTGTYQSFKKMILNDQDFCPSNSPNYREMTDDQMKTLIDDFKINDNNISYGSFFITNDSAIKRVSINGIKPDPENPNYPFIRPIYYMYIAETSDNPLPEIKSFLGFVDHNRPTTKELFKQK